MKLLRSILVSLCRRKARRMFNRPAPVMVGPRVIRVVLACTKADAITARTANYRRSVRRILDMNFHRNTGAKVPHGVAATVLEGTARKCDTRKCAETISKSAAPGDSRKDGIHSQNNPDRKPK